MPALRIISEEGTATPAGPQDFARLPHAATMTVPPMDAAILAAVLYYHRPKLRDWIDETDGQLAERIGGRPCRSTIQLGLTRLETGGWIKRTRSRGRRRIYPLWAWSERARQAVHACPTGRTGAPDSSDMHARLIGHFLEKVEEKKPKGSPTPHRPDEGPTPTPTPGPEGPPAGAELQSLRAWAAEPGNPLARWAWAELDRWGLAERIDPPRAKNAGRSLAKGPRPAFEGGPSPSTSQSTPRAVEVKTKSSELNIRPNISHE